MRLMKETGLVIEALPGGARVKFSAGGACAKCGACMVEGGQWAVISAENSVGAVVGDTVLVDIQPAMFVWASFVLFIFPLIVMITGYFVGSLLAANFNVGSEQNFGILIGALFLLGSFFLIWIYDKSVGRTKKFVCRITRLVKGKQG